MNKNENQQRAILEDIADRAMLERGLLPAFSNEAIAELVKIQALETLTGSSALSGATIILYRDSLYVYLIS